jgi:hypothetical protein
METLTDLAQLDFVPLVAAALEETSRLTVAVEGVARELDRLTAELEGGGDPGREPAAERAFSASLVPVRAEVTQ